MRFFLFILANAMLFIRPSELVPELGEVELYRYVIAACLLVSLPAVVQQVFSRSLGVPPVAACVLGLFPAVILSHLANGNGEEAFEQGTSFLKIVAYFLLVLSLITTTARLRQFLCWLGVFCAILTVIAVVRYHSSFGTPSQQPPPEPESSVSSLEPKEKKKTMNHVAVAEKVRDPETGVLVDVQRMCGTGIFNDPNDLALVLVTAIPLCLWWLTDPKRKSTRPLCIALILLFAYALFLTHSRGGLLALMAGLGALFYLRFGPAKAILAGMLALPIPLVVFAGRMTSISTSEGTGQTRIQLWSDALFYFQQQPLFGVGLDNYGSVSSHVAHNSYLHSYVELGMLGGTFFVGAFYFALHGLYRARSAQQTPGAENLPERAEHTPPQPAPPDADPELQRLHPYLMAMFVAYAVGISFLSRGNIVPTYLMLGLAVVYMRLRATGTTIAWCKLVPMRLAAVSVGYLIVSYTFVRVFVSWN